ncbi:MAG: PAS domain S-box protein, partial [Methanosarcinales archaeon]
RKIKYYGMHLKDTKDYLDHIIENANDIIYTVDLKGNFNLLNKKAESISGYRREELIGKHFSKIVAPEYVEESIERFKRRIKGEAISPDYELEIITKEGKRVLLELTVSAIRKSGKIVGVHGIARDITEKRKLEQKILEEKEYNENVIESSPIAIHVFDENLRVISANKAFYDYSGLKEEEVIGNSIYELLPKQVLEKYEIDKKIIKVMETGETIEDSEVEFKSPRVGERILNIKYALVKETGEGAQNVMVMIDDVTEKAKLQKDLEYAYKELKELDKMKSNFINVVAHELRTPLAVIKGFIDILALDKEKNLTDKQKEHLKVMDKNVNQLNKLINDMLYLSHADSGKLELHIETLNIANIVNSVIDNFIQSIKEKKQSITINIPDSLIIEGDEQKINQIFSNLISNAVKYTPEGGKIYINIEERDKDIIVKVKDTGIGIPEKDLSKVFEKFYLVDADSLTREVDRIGLGLSIVKNNVKLHGGNIWVESKLGEGSTFGFTLPKKGVRG